MSYTNVSPACFLDGLNEDDLTVRFEEEAEIEGYKPTNTTLAIYPNGIFSKVHYAFITVDTNWSLDEMSQALLRAASKSHAASKPPGGYKAVNSLTVGAGPWWREGGLESPDPVVQESNYKQILKVLAERVGNFILIADMEG